MTTGMMKDSGAAWIGQIPYEWTISKIKFVSQIVQGSTPDTNNQDYWTEEAGINWLTPTDMLDDGYVETTARQITQHGYASANTTLLPIGSTIISTRAPIGKINRNATELCTNQGCKSLIAKKIDSDFLYWAALAAKNEMIVRGRGTTFMELASQDLGSISLPIPTLDEQSRIARALNAHITSLDAYTQVVLQQIKTLERYKKSLIHEVVTKGLDPDGPLKPSGIEWFPMIPEDWSVKPFKYIASVAANLVEPSSYAHEIQIDPENIESDSGRLMNVLTVEEVGSISAKQRFVKGQILYSKIRPALNKVTIAPDDGLCSADMYPISTDENTGWLRYFMASDAFVSQTVLHSMRVAMPKINVEKLGTVKVAIPPPSEQQVIADYLDERCAKVDAVLEIKRQQVEALKKQRQSLIYEYVTGKRRVGEVA